jgi:hypothetical protein
VPVFLVAAFSAACEGTDNSMLVAEISAKAETTV